MRVTCNPSEQWCPLGGRRGGYGVNSYYMPVTNQLRRIHVTHTAWALIGVSCYFFSKEVVLVLDTSHIESPPQE